MKKIYVLAFSLMLLSSIGFGDVLRVNNMLTTNVGQKVFASIQEAHDFAAVGDTLMIEASSRPYSEVQVSKKLVFIGTGYFLDENPNVTNSAMSIVERFSLLPESSGSMLIGLIFSSQTSAHTPTIWSANNIVIMRCHLSRSILLSSATSITSLTIVGNYFQGTGITSATSNVSFTGVVFNNNIVNGNLDPGLGTNSFQRVFSSIENNIFRSGVQVSASRFRSNILTSNNSNITINSNDVQNNLTIGNQLPGNGNQIFAASQMFVGPEGNSTDGQYRIKEDSPYKAAGFGNTEPGIFGGTFPYVLSGIPPVPTIFEFSADSFGSKEDGLTIQLKAKSNF